MNALIDNDPLPSLYFRWLYDQVVQVLDIEGMSSYWTVCSAMHDIPFKALVNYDSNRAAEGVILRNRFLQIHLDEEPDPEDLMPEDASIFEVLVALANRANLMIEMDVPKWFQLFLKNLGLDRYHDWYCSSHFTGNIARILDRFNNRTYKPDGRHGGLFPLTNPAQDQRQVELWYQMGAFMTEHSMY